MESKTPDIGDYCMVFSENECALAVFSNQGFIFIENIIKKEEIIFWSPAAYEGTWEDANSKGELIFNPTKINISEEKYTLPSNF